MDEKSNSLNQEDENSKYTVERLDSFDKMNLNEQLLRGIYAYGFEKPSIIQSLCIVPISKGLDVIGQAQSGTGKTGTFSIGILNRINAEKKAVQAVLVSPTRELAYQINDVISNIGKYLDVTVVPCVGGSNVWECKKQIENGAQIVVGTPGRIIDMMEKDYIQKEHVEILLFDEADELLSPGFQNQVKRIIGFVKQECQICLFSATLSTDNIRLTKHFMNKPVKVLVKKEQLTLEGIKQFFVNVEREEWKLETLCDLYGTIMCGQSIIYVNTKRKADWLKEKFLEKNFTVSVIHSDMEQSRRKEIMRNFRTGESRVLISTDLLARGIDIQQVSLVINYDIPNNKENYLHRIGRSGRYGRKGVSINFVTKFDMQNLRDIENFYQTQIESMPSNISEFF